MELPDEFGKRVALRPDPGQVGLQLGEPRHLGAGLVGNIYDVLLLLIGPKRIFRRPELPAERIALLLQQGDLGAGAPHAGCLPIGNGVMRHQIRHGCGLRWIARPDLDVDEVRVAVRTGHVQR